MSVSTQENITVNISNVQFETSVWFAQHCHMSFAQCDMKFLTLVLSGKQKGIDTDLRIMKSKLGAHIHIFYARAMVEHCHLFDIEVVERKTACILVYNATLVIKSSHIEYFQGKSFLQVETQGFANLRKTVFVDCFSTVALIDIANQSALSVDECTFLSNNNTLVNIVNTSFGNIKNSTFKFNNMVPGMTLPFLIRGIKNTVLQINLSHFSYNALSWGESLFACHDHCLGTIENSVFLHNKRRVVSIINSSNLIKNSIFDGNSGQQHGIVTMTQDRFFHTKDTNDSVILSSADSKVPNTILRQEIYNCTFVNNTSVTGGAIASANVSLYLIECQFINNTATGFPRSALNAGGAVFVAYCHANVTRCMFDGNKALSGGAFAAESSVLFVVSSNFSRNEATFNDLAPGGGMFVQISEGSRLTIVSSIFTANHASDSAGAVATIFTFQGSTFHGGRRNSLDAAVKIYDSTFDANSAGGDAGALSVKDQAKSIFHTVCSQTMKLAVGELFMQAPMSACHVRCATFTTTLQQQGESVCVF